MSEVHFVRQDVDPVGFLLWRLHTLLRDVEADQSETQGLDLDVREEERWFDPAELEHKRERNAELSGFEKHETSDSGSLSSLVARGDALAEGKDHHDPEVIAALTALVTQALALRGDADEADNASFNKL